MGENQKYFFEFGEYRLDPGEHQLLLSGKVVALTPKAFETLRLLVENAGHLLEKDRLMEMLWAEAFVEEGNLADNVSKIRQALGDSRKAPRFIETVSGRGYRFIADVHRITIGAASDVKHCPKCYRSYADETLNFCLEDGNVLLEGHATAGEPATVTPSEPGAAATGFRDGDVARPRVHTTDQTAIFPSRVDAEPQESPPGLEERQGFSAHQMAKPFRNLGGKNHIIVVSGIVVLLLIGGFFAYRFFTPTQIESIAVMPFVNESGNADSDYLSDGMTETLINGLSQIPNLNVKARTTVFRYKGKEIDPQKIAAELGVQAILTGRVVQRGDALTLNLELIDAQTENILWGNRYERRIADLVEFQTEIARDVSSKLKSKLSGAEGAKVGKNYTTNPEAYQLYLKGRFFWSKLTPEGLQKSLDFYAQAIEIDPNYALAYAGLADSYNLLGSYGFWPLRDSHPKARAAAEKALALDGDLAEAHASLASVIADYYWDWDAAESHFKRAIELNPNYPVARSWYSQHLDRMGRLDEAVEEARLAQRLDPLSSSASSHVGLALYRARRYEEAAAELQKTLEFDTKAIDAHIFIGLVYVEQRKTEEAIAEFKTVVDLSEQNPSMLALLAFGYASAGQRGEAQEILKGFSSQSGKQPVSQFETAMIYIALGDRDQAFVWLEKAYEERAWQLGFLNVEPIFDPIRSDPRFADLARRVKLTPRT